MQLNICHFRENLGSLKAVLFLREYMKHMSPCTVEPHDILKVKKRLVKSCVLRHGVHQLLSCFTSFDIPPELHEHPEYNCLRPRYFPLSRPKKYYVHYGAPEIKVNPVPLTLLHDSYA
jgi:hypothetical protein